MYRQRLKWHMRENELYFYYYIKSNFTLFVLFCKIKYEEKSIINLWPLKMFEVRIYGS